MYGGSVGRRLGSTLGAEGSAMWTNGKCKELGLGILFKLKAVAIRKFCASARQSFVAGLLRLLAGALTMLLRVT